MIQTEGEIFKNAINAAQMLLSECTLVFDSNGMFLGGIDETKVAMIKVKMSPAAFKDYSIKSPLAITVYMSELWKILKKVGSKSVVSMDYDSEQRVLKIRITGGGYESRYNLKTLETKITQLPNLKVDLAWSGKLVSKHFADAINDIAGYTNAIRFTGEKDKLTLFGMGDKVDIEKVFQKDGESTLNIEHKGVNPVVCYFGSEYLTQIMSASVSDVFILSFGEAQPAYMDFTIPAKLKVEYWLAPRAK